MGWEYIAEGEGFLTRPTQRKGEETFSLLDQRERKRTRRLKGEEERSVWRARSLCSAVFLNIGQGPKMVDYLIRVKVAIQRMKMAFDVVYHSYLKGVDLIPAIQVVWGLPYEYIKFMSGHEER